MGFKPWKSDIKLHKLSYIKLEREKEVSCINAYTWILEKWY